MSLDEQIEFFTELLDRVLEVSRLSRSVPLVPLLLTEEVILAEVDAGQDDALMRTYILKLEEAVRRARAELPPGVAKRCFSDLDLWLSQNYWLDFVHR